MYIFFVYNMDFMFSVYAMCLFSISIICFFLIKFDEDKVMWELLGLFSLIFSIHALFEIVTLEPGLLKRYAVAKTILLVLAYLCPIEYARIKTRQKLQHKSLLGRWIYVPLLLFVAYEGYRTGDFSTVNTLSRYILGIFGGVWSAVAIIGVKRKRDEYKVFIAIAILAVAFSLTNIIVPTVNIFPANIINQDSFSNFVGFPIQFIRVLLSITLLVVIFFGFNLTGLSIRAKKYIATLFFLLIIAGFFITRNIGISETLDADVVLLSRARTAAAAVNPRRLLTLTGSIKDLNNPDYKRLKEVVTQVRKANSDFRFAYIVGVRDKAVFFYVDSEPETSPDYSAPGDQWKRYPPGLLRVFSEGATVVNGPYTDEWGTWVSGFSPVRDFESGKIIAALALDVDAASWHSNIFKHRSLGLMITLGLYLALTTVFVLLTLRSASSKAISGIQKKFEQAFHAPAIIHLITRLNGEIIDANDTFLETFGLTRQEAIGKTTVELGIYYDLKDRSEMFEELVRDGETSIKEQKYKTKDGQIITGLVSLSLVDTSDGKYVIGSINNITNLKKIEEELKDREQYFRTVMDSIQAGIVIVDVANFSIIDLNPAASQMLKLSKEKLIGADCKKYICKRDCDTCPVIDENQKVVSRETYITDGEGNSIPIIKTAVEITLGGKKCILENFIDITDRKKAEKALNDVLESLKETQNIAHLGSLEFDPETGIATWSEESCRIFGLSPAESSPTWESFMSLVHKDDVKKVEANWGKLFYSNEPVETELRHLMPDGSTHYALSKLQKVERDKKIKIIGSIMDVTQIKLAEQEIDRISKVKDDFLSITSHDLKSPLGIVKTSMNLLLEEPNITASIKEYAELSLRQANRGLKIISDLLDLKKLESGNVKLEISRFNVTRLIDEVSNDFKVTLDHKGIKLKVSSDDSYEVNADYSKLAQVVSNLLSNAIKYTQKGGTISIHSKRSDDKLEVSVSDTGEGIPSDKLKDIFEKYGQARISDKKTGTGMGLTIARYICALHGGNIWVESQYGKGSTFSFTIPNVSIATNRNNHISHSSRTILIVDDTHDERIVVKNILEKNGYKTLEAINWKEALDKIRHQIIDLVLLDIEMPDMNGWDLLGIIRREKKKKELPVIIYSSKITEAEYDKKAGANDYVQKHENQSVLISKIEKLIG